MKQTKKTTKLVSQKSPAPESESLIPDEDNVESTQKSQTQLLEDAYKIAFILRKRAERGDETVANLLVHIAMYWINEINSLLSINQNQFKRLASELTEWPMLVSKKTLVNNNDENLEAHKLLIDLGLKSLVKMKRRASDGDSGEESFFAKKAYNIVIEVDTDRSFLIHGLVSPQNTVEINLNRKYYATMNKLIDAKIDPEQVKNLPPITEKGAKKKWMELALKYGAETPENQKKFKQALERVLDKTKP